MLRAAELVVLCLSSNKSNVDKTLAAMEKAGTLPPAGAIATHEISLGHDARATRHFLSLHAKLCAALDRGSDLVVVVDEYDVNSAGVKAHFGWSALVSMLILSLPEVRWIFVSVVSAPADPKRNAVYEHFRAFITSHFGLERLRSDHGPQLFDGMGLREVVLKLNDIGPDDGIDDVLSSTKPVALVLDDESQFRSMLSLAAYSWGFRVFSVATWPEALQLVGPSGMWQRNPHPLHQIRLSLEDLCLRYHDQPYSKLDDPAERIRLLPGLSAGHISRHYVSIGDLHPIAPAKTRFWKRTARREEVIPKPTRDYFSLWDEIGGRWGSMPWDGATFSRADTNEPHGAPGRIVIVAETMLARAKRLLAGAPSLQEKLWVAVVSADAFRLLEGRSPMLSAEALYLRHVAEVSVVAGEVGSRSRLDIEPRLNAIERSLTALAEPLPKDAQSLFVTNARLKVVATLEKILSNSSLLNDAGKCGREARQLRGKLGRDAIWSAKSRPVLLRSLHWLGDGYFSFALRSPEAFLVATASTFLGFVMLFAFAQGEASCQGLTQAFHLAVTSFITVNLPPQEGSDLVTVVSYFSSLAGLLHFGILVSLIYTYWVDRR